MKTVPGLVCPRFSLLWHPSIRPRLLCAPLAVRHSGAKGVLFLRRGDGEARRASYEIRRGNGKTSLESPERKSERGVTSWGPLKHAAGRWSSLASLSLDHTGDITLALLLRLALLRHPGVMRSLSSSRRIINST